MLLNRRSLRKELEKRTGWSISLTSSLPARVSTPRSTDSTLANTRTSFSMLFKAALFILTTGVPFAITTYHRKTPVFWLPPGGWLGPLGWFLSFPSAPAGAISSSVW